MSDHESIDCRQSHCKSSTTSGRVKETVKLTRRGHEIPRPKNCFLTYRIEIASALVDSGVGNDSRNISKIVADLWRSEPEAIKQRYREIAAKEKQKHQELYPDYKYMPRKKRSSEERPGKECSPDNPPRKIRRRAKSPRCDRVLKKRPRKAAPRPKIKKRKPSRAIDDTVKGASKKLSILLTPDGRQPLYTKDTLVKKLIENGIIAEDQIPDKISSIIYPPTNEAICEDVINHTDDTEIIAENFDDGHFNFRTPKSVIQANTFLEQEAVSLHSSLFCNPESFCGRTVIKIPTSPPQSPKIEYMSDTEVYPGNETDSYFVYTSVDRLRNDPVKLQLSKYHLDMLESQDSIAPSSLAPSLSATSENTEVGGQLAKDEPTEDLLNTSQGNLTPFFQVVRDAFSDGEQADEYLERLASEDSPMTAKIADHIHELALSLPAVWAIEWQDLPTSPHSLYQHLDEQSHIQEDIPMASTLSLDDYIDVSN